MDCASDFSYLSLSCQHYYFLLPRFVNRYALIFSSQKFLGQTFFASLFLIFTSFASIAYLNTFFTLWLKISCHIIDLPHLLTFLWGMINWDYYHSFKEAMHPYCCYEISGLDGNAKNNHLTSRQLSNDLKLCFKRRNPLAPKFIQVISFFQYLITVALRKNVVLRVLHTHQRG
jgi:hypothetical protein